MQYQRARSIDVRGRHRRRGEGYGGCLIMIILVLGGAIFAWNKFGKYRPLITAGGNPIVLKDDNIQGKIEYDRMWREHNKAWTTNTRNSVNKLYTLVVSGKLTDKDEFEQRIHDTYQQLLDGVDNLEMHSVPKDYVQGHKSLGLAYRSFYECITSLHEAYYLEGAERKSALEATHKKLTEGWNYSTKGEMFMAAKVPEIKH